MNIYFKAQDNCDHFYFYPKKESTTIFLPENIILSDFLFLIQSSLDQIKAVALFFNEEAVKEMNFEKCKSTHVTIVENKFLFLNYSIRNSLTKQLENDFQVKSFAEIESFLLKKFPK